jgi:hypothetical protein
MSGAPDQTSTRRRPDGAGGFLGNGRNIERPDYFSGRGGRGGGHVAVIIGAASKGSVIGSGGAGDRGIGGWQAMS